MERDIEIIKKKMKNQKILLIVLSVILVLSIGVSGYFIYDSMKADNSNNNSNNENGNNNEENINIQLQDGDITNTDLAKRLHKTLITSDGSYGLYFSDKISITDTNNKMFFKFNIIEYGYNKGLNYNEGGDSVGGWNSVTKIEQVKYSYDKMLINDYIQKKYNSNLNYILEYGNDISCPGVATLFRSLEDGYAFFKAGISCTDNFTNQKLMKAEKNSEYVYLYDKIIFCYSAAGDSGCYNIADVSNLDELERHNHLIYSCSWNDDDCSANAEDLAKKMINKLDSKLHTFKHTFKKGPDENYYWVSSEISE